MNLQKINYKQQNALSVISIHAWWV